MAQKKRKSIYDNISLEGLDQFFDIESLKENDARVEEAKNKGIVSNTFSNKLKLKSSKKAVKKFVETLPYDLESKAINLFEKVSTKKLKTKEKIREIVKIIVVQEEAVENVELLEPKEETIIDVVAELDKPSSKVSATRHLEDQLTEAYLKIERHNLKEKELHNTISKLEKKSEEDKEEITWLKSQQDHMSEKLLKIERSWLWKFRSWFTGE